MKPLSEEMSKAVARAAEAAYEGTYPSNGRPVPALSEKEAAEVHRMAQELHAALLRGTVVERPYQLLPARAQVLTAAYHCCVVCAREIEQLSQRQRAWSALDNLSNAIISLELFLKATSPWPGALLADGGVNREIREIRERAEGA